MSAKPAEKNITEKTKEHKGHQTEVFFLSVVSVLSSSSVFDFKSLKIEPHGTTEYRTV
jgi:hypothetical protein